LTGQGEGKLKLRARVFLVLSGKLLRELEGAKVYVHLKGFSRARVTHLDIEHPILGGLLPPRGGRFLLIEGISGGIQIHLDEATTMQLPEGKLEVSGVRVSSKLLNEVLLPRERTRTWVGGKLGGIYVGFKKPQLRKLETLVGDLLGPRNLNSVRKAGPESLKNSIIY